MSQHISSEPSLQPPLNKVSLTTTQPTSLAAVAPYQAQASTTPTPPTFLDRIEAVVAPAPKPPEPVKPISIAIAATPPPTHENFFDSVLTNKPATVQTPLVSPSQQIAAIKTTQTKIKEQPTPSRGQVQQQQQTASQVWQPQQQTNKASLTTQAMPQTKTASTQVGSFLSLIQSQVSTPTPSTQKAGRRA